MHEIDHNEFSHTIVKINEMKHKSNKVYAVITTNFLGRVTTKPYSFSSSEWAEITKKGRID